ncbi:MAG: hypothetical protein U5L96_20925 [Owenweeksia sp.]|nr:hypothetical protein [Owenweeksia sp.]
MKKLVRLSMIGIIAMGSFTGLQAQRLDAGYTYYRLFLLETMVIS